MTNMQQLQLQLQQLPNEKWYTVLWFIFVAKLSSFYPNYFIKWFACKFIVTRSYKTCKTSVKSSPPTNQHPTFYRPDKLPVA